MQIYLISLKSATIVNNIKPNWILEMLLYAWAEDSDDNELMVLYYMTPIILGKFNPVGALMMSGA